MRIGLRVILFLLFLSFILLPAFDFLLHEHEIGGEEHPDCLVCKWINESVIVVSLFLMIILLTILATLIVFRARIDLIHVITLKRIRSPPAQISL
jgi:hypothetical protein